MSERDEVTNLKRQNLAIKAFLNLLDADIRAGRNLQVIPDDLARDMLANAGQRFDFEEGIEGEVAI